MGRLSLSMNTEDWSNMDKVYCEKCFFYKPYQRELLPYGSVTIHGCSNANNCKYRDTPIRLEEILGECIKLNKKNDCRHFTLPKGALP